MIDGVTFKIGKQAHTLRLPTLALARVEQSLNTKINLLLEDGKTGFSVGFVNAAFAAGLNDGKGMDEEEAAEIIDQLGGAFGGAMQIAVDALVLALPKQEEPAADGEEKPPAGKRKPAPKK